MHKLETTQSAPQAETVVTISSQGSVASIILSTSDSWKPSEDDWLKDETKRKQVVSFISDGRTVELAGAVPEPFAVECPACHRVVFLGVLRLDRKSGAMRLAVGRVVEVWESATKQLWKATDWQQKAGATLSASGAVVRAA